MCTYLLVRNKSHSLLQPSFPCFPLMNALLPTVKHWSTANWLSLEKPEVEPAMKVTLYLGSNSRPSLQKMFFCSWKTTEILVFPLSNLTTFQGLPPFSPYDMDFFFLISRIDSWFVKTFFSFVHSIKTVSEQVLIVPGKKKILDLLVPGHLVLI